MTFGYICTIKCRFKNLMKELFAGITPDKLSVILEENAIGSVYAERIITNFYRRGIHDFSTMINLPVRVMAFLGNYFETGLMTPVNKSCSADGSMKFLFNGHDGRPFESVLIPDGKRTTLCVSVQSGCRMGCRFCLTGRMKFAGSLRASEIIGQVLSVPGWQSITHVVFMGMGEPLDNFDEVLASCSILTSGWGLALSPSHVTVSTVGIRDRVEQYILGTSCNLTLSLFSPFPHERAEQVPAEKSYPAGEIISLMKKLPPSRKRRFSIAYVMMKDINDTEAHLDKLKELVTGSRIRINILPYHPLPGDANQPSDLNRIRYFLEQLHLSGVSVSMRKSRGADISAACGLLASGLR